MADEASADAALRPLPPGELIRIGSDALDVRIAPAAGGRIAGIACDGVEWLYGYGEGNAAAIAWGCYPMLPWAGRIRDARFRFAEREYQLQANLGRHAIHGVGFLLPWRLETRSSTHVELALQLPQDRSWPFGGLARQRIGVEGRTLRLELSVTAGRESMPRPVLGWHPWFHKPERFDFAPSHHYPRDAAGFPTAPRAGLPPGPWDDCFLNTRPVVLTRAGQTLHLQSACDHWVIFDEPAQALCVEPQTGPPDAFNLDPAPPLAPRESVAAWAELAWRALR